MNRGLKEERSCSLQGSGPVVQYLGLGLALHVELLDAHGERSTERGSQEAVEEVESRLGCV